jgi:hypothetical protein
MRYIVAVCLILLGAACASAPPAPPKAAVPAGPPFEQKMAWILRLEDQRMLRDPAPPPPPAAPVVPAPARRGQAPVATPPPPVPDLVQLLIDGEARIRRRAALAIGRVGLKDGVQPWSPCSRANRIRK